MHTARAGQPAFFVAHELDRVGQQAEFDALLAGVLGLFGAGRHFGLGAAINQRRGPRSQPPGRPHRVHGGVAAAHHNHVLAPAVVERLVVLVRLVGAHQVHARQKLVGRVDAVEVLAGDAEKLRQSGAGGDENRVVVLVPHQFVDGDALADHHVGLELDAHAAQVVHLALDDGFGQAKLRNAVDEYAADLVQSLKNAHPMAFLDEVSGGAQTGRPAAHNGHALAR